MEFTDENKQAILNLLRTGQSDAAKQFIASRYGATAEDSKKLLEAFEYQFSNLIQEGSPPQNSSAGCAGCLSGVLKVMAILIGIGGAGTMVIGYFLTNLFGETWNNKWESVMVSGYTYSRPDSSFVNLIYQYRSGVELKLDTGTIEYPPGLYHSGDTIRIMASELDRSMDEEVLLKLKETQEVIYLFGGAGLFIALLIWFVSSRIKT